MAPSKMRVMTLCVIAALFTAAHAGKIKGMAFSTGHDTFGYRQPFADQSLKDLKATGANFVHISAYAKQKSVTSGSAKQETDDASIRFIIRKCKKKGFKVFFKPVIEIDGNVWRGFIKGGDFWFTKVYTPFIVKMAKIAQEEKVDLFAVGSEYVGTLDQTKQWNRVIRKVKNHFKGKITYVGNHDSFMRVKFWNKLSVISISGYFKLLEGTNGPSPNLKETKKLWKDTANSINAWRLKNKFKKKVLIAEIGAQSKGNGVVYRIPWDWLAKAPVNFNEQVKMYDGILGAFMPAKWCKGVILWNWELDPNAGKSPPSNAWYTPQNKPALQIMKKWFKKKL